MKNRHLFIFTIFAFSFLFCFQAFAQEASSANPSVAHQAVMSPKEFIFGTIQFLCMGLIVYFLMVINPQKAADESHTQFMDNLKKNDDVTTTSGMYGKVVSISPDQITVEISPNVKVRFQPKHILPLPKTNSNAKKE